MLRDVSKIGQLTRLLDCLLFLEQSSLLWSIVDDCVYDLDVEPTLECVRTLICAVSDAQHSILIDFDDGK